ncbi:aliphatic sulfonate ABC transporter substrate-binding protein [Stutzerimonas kirkiae]|uniref:Putative aliphatic sulfonates-binding protein n=1 Tax=Stutzerimonas kirkiae TaxID=2211392 RepID=A0A4Q9R4G8_9GAMM|nr:aliphatic sulfonate ABC transporter substrate-binding protein [Stutzerimonas kirkiae]TBU93285.1 aliphatic sulfonates ABC transporter substrate-binding protein [Stutzerimonas kirkiae]TBV01419.1 aliphatic sulfonates ABC transporter substrate-binding protein [Stutzerimonas kirkiae]TBV06884.1 aliphatic sulfonates ABC transporter substrate-binding protein [Stutzerimonas kirkiae]
MLSSINRRTLVAGIAAFATFAAVIGFGTTALAQGKPVKQITLDYATYNPVGLVLKEKGFLEEELAADGISVRWVQTLGSNKALEFLNAGSIDFGSTYAAAALVGRINGNPIKSVYVYTRPTGVALLKPAGSTLASAAELKGKRVAVTRGTDPHIFLIRALAKHGLNEKDIQSVLLQHGDGRLALARGDVDAWAGLDPLTAAAEIENGAQIFVDDPELSTWGFLNVREAFAQEHPELVKRVLAAYERARLYSLEHPDEVATALVALARLPENIIARQLQREDLSQSRIGAAQRTFVLEAGQSLQAAGVVDAKVDIVAVVDELIDTRFTNDGN